MTNEGKTQENWRGHLILTGRPGKPPSISPCDRLVTFDEIAAAYEQANSGKAGTVETTLEELLGHPVQGGDPPW